MTSLRPTTRTFPSDGARSGALPGEGGQVAEELRTGARAGPASVPHDGRDRDRLVATGDGHAQIAELQLASHVADLALVELNEAPVLGGAALPAPRKQPVDGARL